jgi:hypothetical protein
MQAIMSELSAQISIRQGDWTVLEKPTDLEIKSGLGVITDLVLENSCTISFGAEPSVTMSAGDLPIIPSGQHHRLNGHTGGHRPLAFS